MSKEIKNKPIPDDEIDLIQLAKKLWNGRKVIIVSVFICFCIGITVAFFSPKRYTASSTMVPILSSSGSKLGGLSSLAVAAMAGFNLDTKIGGNELSPYIYPQIIESVPFQLELMNTPFQFEGIDHPVSIYEYYQDYYESPKFSRVKKYTLGLPGIIMNAIRPKTKETKLVLSTNPNEPILLTQKEENVRGIISSGVTMETNDVDGYVVINAETLDPYLSAQVAKETQRLLQRYITEFKTEKATAQLKFIEERYEENQKEFEEAQAALATFRDRNKNVTSAIARTQEERLQSDYQLAFGVYSGLAQKMEQARIQVKEETPVFSIIKPVTVPLETSKPNRAMIIMIWTFLGGVIGIGWIFGKQFIATLKIKWKEGEENIE